MEGCMLNLWPFELSLHSCSGPWIWSHMLCLLSCFPKLHTMCYKYLRFQPGKNENVIRVRSYAKLHQLPSSTVSYCNFKILDRNEWVFLFMVLSRSQTGMIVTSPLFYVYWFPVSQMRASQRELEFSRVSLRQDLEPQKRWVTISS